MANGKKQHIRAGLLTALAVGWHQQHDFVLHLPR